MLKAISGTLQERAGKPMTIVRTAQEVLANYDAIEDPLRPSLMLQEYIPGGDDTIWMFNGYFDKHGECRVGFTGKKMHQHPPYTGATSFGNLSGKRSGRKATIRFSNSK